MDIKEIEMKYKKKVKEIRENKEILISTIKEARKQTDVTIVKLAKILDVSKTTVGRYAKK